MHAPLFQTSTYTGFFYQSSATRHHLPRLSRTNLITLIYYIALKIHICGQGCASTHAARRGDVGPHVMLLPAGRKVPVQLANSPTRCLHWRGPVMLRPAAPARARHSLSRSAVGAPALGANWTLHARTSYITRCDPFCIPSGLATALADMGREGPRPRWQPVGQGKLVFPSPLSIFFWGE